MIRFVQWTLACCLLVSVGCSKTHFPVTGRVTFKDGRDVKTLMGGVVMLEPIDKAAVTNSRGAIREDGSFTIGTVTDTDGVPPGKYTVLVLPPALPRPAERPKGWPPLKAKYGHPDQSPFKFDVETKSNVLNLEVD